MTKKEDEIRKAPTAYAYDTEHNILLPSVEVQPPPLMKELPTGTWGVALHPMIGYHLKKIEDFELPPRVYGDFSARADRILKTFRDRPYATGVMLSGTKGSGKTLLAKMLSAKLREVGISTLVVTSPERGEGFFQFIQDIKEPAMVLFDEYEKTYSEDEHRNALLALLDGAYPTKKLFVLTCNERTNVSSYIRNRPGRIYYSIEFDTVDDREVEEYAADQLRNKEHADSLIKMFRMFPQFSFDMLKAVVEEMNRFGEDAFTASKMLNARAFEDPLTARFWIDIRSKDNAVMQCHTTTSWKGVPFYEAHEKRISLLVSEIVDNPNDDRKPEKRFVISIEAKHYVKGASERGKLVYRLENGITVTFTPTTGQTSLYYGD